MRQPDREDWERVYREAFPRVYRALVTVVRDRDVAMDALHDAFLEGLEHPPSHDANLTGWLYRVALRRARRSMRRAAVAAIRAAVGLRYGADLSEVFDRAEVSGLLAILSPRQRAMVIAEYYLDLDQEEIAKIFGVQRGTVAATLAQARARMRTGGQNAS